MPWHWVSLSFRTTVNGTATHANGDYSSSASFLSFVTEDQLPIVIEVNGDEVVEEDEHFFVDLSGIDAEGRDVTFADDRGVGTILDDDGQPIFVDGFESGDVSSWSTP